MSYYNIPERPLDPPEPRLRRVFTCAICDEPIYEGEDYYDIPELGCCHESCIDECKKYDADDGHADDAYEDMIDRRMLRDE